jgi:8-oxo-dGTP diphosphatase
MVHMHVAAGILRNAAGEVLITERLCDGPFNGLWEFPGGKIDDAETSAAALRRELREELGIVVTTAEPFMSLSHEYVDRTVDLEFFLVNDWDGDPDGLEGQGLRWVKVSQLNEAELLPADAALVQALRKTG